MNDKQKQQFNSMLATLQAIAKKYKSPEQLKKRGLKDYWFDYEECLELEYESIRVEAASSIKGIKPIN